MSPPIYSTQLISALGIAPFTAATYTVPDSATVVVTDIELFAVAASGGPPFFFVTPSGWVLVNFTALTLGDSAQWRGKMVFPAGETFGIYSEGFTVNALVSGWLLFPF